MSEKFPGSYPSDPKYYAPSTGIQYSELPSDVKQLIAEKTLMSTRNELRATHMGQMVSDESFKRDSKRFHESMEEMKKNFPGAFEPSKNVEPPMYDLNLFHFVAEQLSIQDQVPLTQVPGAFQTGGCDVCGGF